MSLGAPGSCHGSAKCSKRVLWLSSSARRWVHTLAPKWTAISSKPWFWIPLAKLQPQFGTGRPPTTLVVIRPRRDSPVGLGLLKNPVRRRPHRLLPIAHPKLRPWRHYQCTSLSVGWSSRYRPPPSVRYATPATENSAPLPRQAKYGRYYVRWPLAPPFW